MQPIAAVAGIILPYLNAPPERSTVVRNSRRALAWREQLERVAGHALATAKSQVEQDAVAEAHGDQVKLGPDWARIRRGSDFASPVAVKDRNALDRLLRWFSMLERETFLKDRAWARHEKRTICRTIPRTARPVLLALIALARKYDSVFPSIERLASMAQCCRRTVVSVLDVLEHVGLVKRHRRRKIIRVPLGQRVVQDTSCYVITAPAGLDQDRKPRPAESRGTIQSANFAQPLKIDHSVKQRGSVADTSPRPSRAYQGPSHQVDWRSVARAALIRR